MTSSHIKSGNELINTKRSKNERSGVHGWHPYYAAYAEGFVESAISYLNLNSEAVLLDPWNGSGTTSLVANRKGLYSVGFDINPVMNIFSMAKTGIILSNIQTIKILANNIATDLHKTQTLINKDDPLLHFVSKSLCSNIRGIFQLISRMEVPLIKVSKYIENLFIKPIKKENLIADFLLAGLFITGRKLAEYKVGSNPTWLKTPDKKPLVKSSLFIESFLLQIEKMLIDLEEACLHPTSEVRNLARDGDSRNLPIKDNSIDGIITSPPYLTRIDYAMSTKPELLILFEEKDFRNIRTLTMGAPIIVDKLIQEKPAWGKICISTVNFVKNHSSRAAKSYYLPYMLQYFRDAEKSLSEIIRVLKPGAKALIVVQSSYFKEHEINLSEIYVNMCKQFPVKASIVARNVVRGHIAYINTRSNAYKGNKIFYEDVIEIIKS